MVAGLCASSYKHAKIEPLQVFAAVHCSRFFPAKEMGFFAGPKFDH